MKLELKIVDLLFRDQEKNFTIHSIAKTLNQHYSLVHRFIGRLSKENIIIKKKIGKSYVCSLNLDNEKTTALLNLSEIERKDGFYSKNKQIKLILEDFVNSLKDEFNEEIFSIVLFGSYAKNAAINGSDIDILLLVKNKIPIDNKIRELYSKYGREINVIILTLNELGQQKKKELFKEIIRNHYILFGADKFIGIMK